MNSAIIEYGMKNTLPVTLQKENREKISDSSWIQELLLTLRGICGLMRISNKTTTVFVNDVVP